MTQRFEEDLKTRTVIGYDFGPGEYIEVTPEERDALADAVGAIRAVVSARSDPFQPLLFWDAVEAASKALARLDGLKRKEINELRRI